MKKNIVALIAGIVLIFGAITAPAFAEEGTHPCGPTLTTAECERFLAGLDTPLDPNGGEPYIPGSFQDPAVIQEQLDRLLENAPPAPSEDPLVGEDGTFTDEAKAEQIDAIEKELDKAPRPNAENDFPQTPEEQIEELSDLIDSREGTSQPNRGKTATERPMLPHTGN